MYKERIIFDIDGTLTDFNSFVRDNAYTFFEKKYHLQPKDESMLEIEDIYGLDIEDDEHRNMINSFWIGPMFLKFTLLGKLRNNACKIVSMFRKKGFTVEIHSSRKHAQSKSLIGFISRTFTLLQLRINGVFIPSRDIHFYKNDEEKMAEIISLNPLLVFDDKKEIVECLSSKGIRTICIAGTHNETIIDNRCLKRVDGFNSSEIGNAINHLFSTRNQNCILNEINSRIFFNRIRFVGKIIKWIYKPIVLHPENMVNDAKEGIVYAPNHRSTLDPLIIESVIDRNIHWAALLRFFKGEDSIFNNSKNVHLCNITKRLFTKLHFFPIERKSDNEDANNYNSIREMNDFLRNRYLIGIFPEGTTRREPGRDFGNFDDSFIALAKKNDAWIQSIVIYWTKEKRNKVIINYGKAFKAGGMDKATAYERYLSEQRNALSEIRNYI